MSVLLVDSDGEMWFTRAKELDVNCISMPYTYDNTEYFYDLGENTDFKHFYKRLREGAVSITSALNPENYKEILTPYFEKGEDVLYVSFSHAMSGTFSQLEKAQEELKVLFPERKLTVFNTNSIAYGAGIQMEQAAVLKKQGKSDEEILAFLKDFTNRVAMYFVVDDLMHLKRGGRLSAAAAFAGTILALKPLLTVGAKGELQVVSKISGKKKALLNLAQKVIDGVVDEDKYSVYVLDADCVGDGDFVRDEILKKRPDLKIERMIIGPVIGSHCGPGTVGVVFVANERPIALKN